MITETSAMLSVRLQQRKEYIKIVIQSEHFPLGMLPMNAHMGRAT